MPDNAMYHAFLSHSHPDTELVEALAQRLEDDAGLRVCLDRWHLGPGDPWPEELNQTLEACRTVAVFFGPTYAGPWHNEGMHAALQARVRDASQRLIPVLLPGAPDPRTDILPTFMKRLAWVDLRAGLDDDGREPSAAFHRLVAAIKGEDDPAVWPRHWQEGLARYLEQIKAQHATFRALGRPETVPLEGIHTDILIVYKPHLAGSLGVGQFQEDLSALGTEGGEQVEGLALMARLEAHRLFVLGTPGAGKTTFLRYLALQAARGEIDKIPILVSLREWSDSGQQLVPFIARQFELLGFPDTSSFIENALEKGRALVLFDGLDEVDAGGGQRERVIAALRAFGRQYLNSPIVIAAQDAAPDCQFEQFCYVQVPSLTELQVDTYVLRWFDERPAVGAQLLLDISEDEHRELRDWACTPLRLSLLCLAVGETGRLPRSRADLYGEAVDALLKGDASRGLGRDEVYRGLSFAQRQRLLARIAAEAFERGEDRIPHKQIERQLIEGIRALIPGTAQDEIDGKAVLAAIEAPHGLLVERAQGVYAFAHPALAEYLTARYIVEHQAHGTLERLVEHHLTDQRWRGVFEWTASMLEDANLLFERFAVALDGLALQEAAIVELLNWVEEGAALEGNPDVEPAAMRGLFLARALDLGRDIVRGYARARNLFRELGRDSNRARARYLDPDLVRSREFTHLFAHELHGALAHARAYARALARDGTREFTYALAHARALDGARDYARVLGFDLFGDADRALELALDLALDLAPDLDLALGRADDPAGGFDGHRLVDLALARHHARALDRGRARGRAHALELDGARPLDLASDLDPAALQHLTEYLGACRLYVACLERAPVSDRAGCRDRLLRAPVSREGEDG